MSILDSIDNQLESGDIQAIKWKLFDGIFNKEFNKYKRNSTILPLQPYIYFSMHGGIRLNELFTYGIDENELEKLKALNIVNLASLHVAFYKNNKYTSEDAEVIVFNNDVVEEFKDYIVRKLYDIAKQ